MKKYWLIVRADTATPMFWSKRESWTKEIAAAEQFDSELDAEHVVQEQIFNWQKDEFIALEVKPYWMNV